MILCVDRLRDFLCVDRLRDFSHSLTHSLTQVACFLWRLHGFFCRYFVNFFVKWLRDFCV